MRIFLDMDEVLADFSSPALESHGIDPSRFFATYPAGHWGIHTILGCSQEVFWKPIKAQGAAFWEGLNALPWMEEILRVVRLLTDEWCILSSPCWTPECIAGKVRWIEEHIGKEEAYTRLIVTSQKHLFATSNSILIDDREETLRKFQEYGGRSIIFPCLFNSKHEEKEDPIPYVRTMLLNEMNPVAKMFYKGGK